MKCLIGNAIWLVIVNECADSGETITKGIAFSARRLLHVVLNCIFFLGRYNCKLIGRFHLVMNSLADTEFVSYPFFCKRNTYLPITN